MYLFTNEKWVRVGKILGDVAITDNKRRKEFRTNLNCEAVSLLGMSILSDSAA